MLINTPSKKKKKNQNSSNADNTLDPSNRTIIELLEISPNQKKGNNNISNLQIIFQDSFSAKLHTMVQNFKKGWKKRLKEISVDYVRLNEISFQSWIEHGLFNFHLISEILQLKIGYGFGQWISDQIFGKIIDVMNEENGLWGNDDLFQEINRVVFNSKQSERNNQSSGRKNKKKKKKKGKKKDDEDGPENATSFNPNQYPQQAVQYASNLVSSLQSQVFGTDDDESSENQINYTNQGIPAYLIGTKDEEQQNDDTSHFVHNHYFSYFPFLWLLFLDEYHLKNECDDNEEESEDDENMIVLITELR